MTGFRKVECPKCGITGTWPMDDLTGYCRQGAINPGDPAHEVQMKVLDSAPLAIEAGGDQ